MRDGLVKMIVPFGTGDLGLSFASLTGHQERPGRGYGAIRAHGIGAPGDFPEPPREVDIIPGQCVTWRCAAPVEGDAKECPEHAAEPLPPLSKSLRSAQYQRERRERDPEWREKQRLRSLAKNRAARADPEKRKALNEGARRRRAAASRAA